MNLAVVNPFIACLVDKNQTSARAMSFRLFSTRVMRPHIQALSSKKPYKRTAPRKKWVHRRPFEIPERPESYLPSGKEKCQVKSISSNVGFLKRSVDALEKNRPFTIPKGEFRPKQTLGQNFLSDQNYVNKIVEAFSCSSKVRGHWLLVSSIYTFIYACNRKGVV